MYGEENKLRFFATTFFGLIWLAMVGASIWVIVLFYQRLRGIEQALEKIASTLEKRES